MTTETAPDPTIEAWSDDLEEELVEAGMESSQARAYRRAFELGLTRVLSQTATKHELQDGLAMSRKDLQDGLAMSRKDLQEGLAQSRQELRDGLAQSRQELQDAVAQLRAEMRDMRKELQREMEIRGRYLILSMTVGFGILAGLMGAILSKL